ncbi:MAG: hypothetical protein RLZZ176_3302 [Cyanobacteriota bacterium]
MLPREELLKGVENRDTIARVIDQADQAIKTWEVVLTDFLSPPELAEIQRVFSRLTEVHLLPWGGYPQAERQRIAIARSELPLDQSEVALVALEIAGNFLFPGFFRGYARNWHCAGKNRRCDCIGGKRGAGDCCP